VLGPLLIAIRAARPGMKLRARAVVEAIVLSHGPIGSAEHVARTLGLKNRFQLARLLQENGLPPLHRLTEWVTVLSWIATAEESHVSLCWMAFRSKRHPSACYRLVKKVTGHGWAEVHAKGSVWALRQFLKELKVWGRRVAYHPPVPAVGRRVSRPIPPTLRLS
jgi:hypothetical protein